MTLPSQGRLLALFRYDPETGLLYWRDRLTKKGKPMFRNGMVAGGRGCLKHGYIRLIVDGVQHWAHRVIWKMVTGEDPPEKIDHRDTDGGNNRWDNLRPATNRDNLCNRGKPRNNRSGFKGVHLHACGRWTAQIRYGGPTKHLGLFDSPEEAALAYAKAAAEMHGEFARHG